MPLLTKDLDLFLGETGEAEHANLVGDVVPGTWSALLLETLSDTLSHLEDAAGHGAEVLLPLLEQGGVIEDERGNAGTVGRGVRDLGSLQDSKLGGNIGEGLGGVRSGSSDEVEGTSTLAVETEVFGEGLGDAHLEALGDKVADSPGVTGEVTGGETLVGAVEEGEVVAFVDDSGNLLPLVLGGIYTGGIVGAWVKEDDGARRSRADSLEHTLKVETLVGWVEVRVIGRLEVDGLEDLRVVGPCWVGEVDGGLGSGWEELGDEQASKMDGTGARDCLESDDLRGGFLVSVASCRCDWTRLVGCLTLLSLMAGEFSPRMSF